MIRPSRKRESVDYLAVLNDQKTAFSMRHFLNFVFVRLSTRSFHRIVKLFSNVAFSFVPLLRQR